MISRSLVSTGDQRSVKKYIQTITWFRPSLGSIRHTARMSRRTLRVRSSALSTSTNRSNVKVSYSCTGNMSSIIKSHNAKILANSDTRAQSKSCNCRNKDLCPLDGAISKIGNGESRNGERGTGNGERGMGNGESLK